MTVDEALEQWFETWSPRRSVEDLPVRDAIGRVLAADVAALVSNPMVDVAAMDGIAVTAADIAGAPYGLGHDQYDRVDTGDPMPWGRDTVVKKEDLRPGSGAVVLVPGSVTPGRHVRRRGEDFEEGETLFPAGHRLRPVDAALLAAAGHGDVVVVRKPRITVIPTGDEVRPAGTRIAPGEVIDSNSVLIAGTVAERGATTRVVPVVPDDPDLLARVVDRAVADADLVVVIAGSSAGQDDYTHDTLARIGSVVVHHLPIRPGHPMILGTVRGVPVIGVPGYPLAAARVTELFGCAAVDRLLITTTTPRRIRAVLDVPVVSPTELDEQLIVQMASHPLDGHRVVRIVRRGSGALTSLMRADGILRAPHGCSGWDVGDEVFVEPRPGSPLPMNGSTIFPQ